MSLNRSDLQKGGEPYSCFSLQNLEKIIGKKIGISNEAQPDLVVKVDLTSVSSNRLSLYQQLGIIEIGRDRGGTVQIYQTQNPRYFFCEYSLPFPLMPATLLDNLVQMSETQDDNAIVRYWGQSVRQQLQT